MDTLPLHPAIVHLPLGLAFVIPLVALGLTIALFRGWLPGRAWAVLVGLQLVLQLGGMAAMNTGEGEEEKVENVVPESRIEAHEGMAKQFMLGSALVLLVGIGGLFLSDEKKRYAALAVTVGSMAVAGLAVRVGHAGGELVYTHGAASAYANQANPGAQPGTNAEANAEAGGAGAEAGEGRGAAEGAQAGGHEGGHGDHDGD